MTRTKTKAGRNPEEALDQIEAQAQERSTCPVGKGKGNAFGASSKLDGSGADLISEQPQ